MITVENDNLSDIDNTDPGLEVLLQLDNEIFPMENGFWTKFEAKQVAANEHIPHGIKYSLTLHNPSNTRVLGYDNAHGLKPKKKKYGAKKLVWDHKHEKNKVELYEFENAAQLMTDFWSDVDRIISELHG